MNPDILSSPINIGEKTAPNRIVDQPMECNDGDASGSPTESTLRRYRSLAEGGAGIIVVESLALTAESRARKNQLKISEGNAKGLERLVKEVKEINGKSLVLFQMNHAGRTRPGGLFKGRFPISDRRPEYPPSHRRRD